MNSTYSAGDAPVRDADTAAVAVRGATKVYRTGEQTVRVLDELDLTVAPGETVAILGVSGTGKSTLLNILGGLDPVDDGTVIVGGLDLRRLPPQRLSRFRAETVGFIFQFYNLIPTLTVLENVLAGLQPMRRTTRADEGRVMETLDRVGLADKRDAFPNQLSGGQQQRVAIARALVKRAPVILADEPTGNLDRATAEGVGALLIAAAKAERSAMVVVTHDRSMIGIVDKAYRMDGGRLVLE